MNVTSVLNCVPVALHMNARLCTCVIVGLGRDEKGISVGVEGMLDVLPVMETSLAEILGVAPRDSVTILVWDVEARVPAQISIAELQLRPFMIQPLADTNPGAPVFPHSC